MSISSGNASVLVGTGGAYTQALALTTDANGSLNQAVSVQYTAPSAAGIATVTIANTSGAQSAPVTVSTTATATPTYVWTGATSTSWSEPTNWSPNRTAPGGADILKFDGGTANVTVDFSGSQTIGQLLLVNGVKAIFSTDGNRTLNIDNNLPGDDFVVGSGTNLTVTNSGPAATAALTISLASAETGNVAGTIVFAGSSSSATGRHALQAAGTNAVQFVAGSVFRQATTYDGSTVFGSTASSIVFRNGSRYEQYGGGNPFTLIYPASVATFEPTSYYLFALPSGSPSLNGRTVGNMEFASANVNATGAGLLTVQGNLLVSSGTVGLNLTGGATLLGNVTVNNAAVLNFLPASPATFTLAGSAIQTLSGNSTAASPINFGNSTNSNATLQINNASGVAVAITTSLYGPLQLSSGILSPSTVNTLVLTPSVSVIGGSATSYVSGPVRRTVPAGGSGSFTFPVGKGANYRPLTLTVANQGSVATIYQAEQFDQDAGTSVTSPLQRVSRNRYFTVTPYSAATPTQVQQPTGFSGTITLSYGYDDKVNNPASLVIAKRADSSQPWASIGFSGFNSTGTSTGPGGTYASGTVTSGAFTSFSDFTLGSTTSDNPLPVQLARFTAQRAGADAVALAWTTASELNSARFEVERSFDGLTFELVATVAAQGSSAQAHGYTSRDAAAPTGPLYYRLKMVDLDGTFAYSTVVAVGSVAGAPLAAYPNPTTGELTLPGAAGQPVSLLDALGRPVRQLTLGTAERLNMSDLPTGLYLLRVPGQPAQRITKQ